LAGDKSTLSDSGISVSCNSTLAPETFKYISKNILPREVKWDASSPQTAQRWLESYIDAFKRHKHRTFIGTHFSRSFLWHFAFAWQILCRITHLDSFFLCTQANMLLSVVVLKENLLWMGNIICMLPKFRQDLTQTWRRGTHLPLFLDL